jgi:hypothetical protein
MSSDSVKDFDDGLFGDDLLGDDLAPCNFAEYDLAAKVSAANGPMPSWQLWS